MRVKGPSGAAPPIDQTSAVDASSAAEATTATTAVAGVAATGAATAAQATDPTADPVRDVARRLRTGELSAREAVELLIDDAVERQLGLITADRRALAQQLKEVLRRYTETDPHLASKVRRLESHKR